MIGSQILSGETIAAPGLSGDSASSCVAPLSGVAASVGVTSRSLAALLLLGGVRRTPATVASEGAAIETWAGWSGSHQIASDCGVGEARGQILPRTIDSVNTSDARYRSRL